MHNSERGSMKALMPSHAEFVKWACPDLNLELSTVSFRDTRMGTSAIQFEVKSPDQRDRFASLLCSTLIKPFCIHCQPTES